MKKMRAIYWAYKQNAAPLWRKCANSLQSSVSSPAKRQSSLASPQFKLFPLEPGHICWKDPDPYSHGRSVNLPRCTHQKVPPPQGPVSSQTSCCLRHTLLRFEWLSAGGAARLLRWWGKVGISSGSQAAQRRKDTRLMISRTSQSGDYSWYASTHVEASLWSRSSPNSLWL